LGSFSLLFFRCSPDPSLPIFLPFFAFTFSLALMFFLACWFNVSDCRFSTMSGVSCARSPGPSSVFFHVRPASFFRSMNRPFFFFPSSSCVRATANLPRHSLPTTNFPFLRCFCSFFPHVPIQIVVCTSTVCFCTDFFTVFSMRSIHRAGFQPTTQLRHPTSPTAEFGFFWRNPRTSAPLCLIIPFPRWTIPPD